MSPKGTALLAGGFVLGWATCLFQGLWAHRGGMSWEKERIPDGGEPSRYWTHPHGLSTGVAVRGEACQHCGATEDGA